MLACGETIHVPVGFPLLLIPFAIYNMIAFLLHMSIFTDTLFTHPR